MVIIMLARSQTGGHGNNYVKVAKKSGPVGKYLIDEETWETGDDMSPKEKKAIEEWLEANRSHVENEFRRLKDL